MVSTKEYLDFVLGQLSELNDVSSRAMMGEYLLYCRGKLFGGIHDDRLLVKPVPSAVKIMPSAKMVLPYEGAKKCCLSKTWMTGNFSADWSQPCGTIFLRRKGSKVPKNRFANVD